MKKVLGLVVAVSLLAWTIGCASGKYTGGRGVGGGGGGGGGGSNTIQSGNWAFITNGSNGTIHLGGYLTASGTSVSGNLFVVGSSATGFTLSNASVPMSTSGSISNGSLTLVGVYGSSTISLTFSVSGTGLTSLPAGTFTVTGGSDAGDTGTVSGIIAGDFSGTWQGVEPVTGGVVNVAFTEATTPNTSLNRLGSFVLTSTGTGITFSGVAGCNVTGTLDSTNSFTAGDMVYLVISTTDQATPGHLTFLGFANNAASPTSLANGGYIYQGGSGCMLQNDANEHALTLTKQ